MRCPRCHTENPSTYHFCRICGQALPVVEEELQNPEGIPGAEGMKKDQENFLGLHLNHKKLSNLGQKFIHRKPLTWKGKLLISCIVIAVWSLSLFAAFYTANIYRSPESISEYFVKQSNRGDYAEVLKSYPPECRQPEDLETLIRDNNAQMSISIQETYGGIPHTKILKTDVYTSAEVKAQSDMKGSESDWAKWWNGMEGMRINMQLATGITVNEEDCYLSAVKVRNEGEKRNRTYTQYTVVIQLNNRYYVCPTEYTPDHE